MAETANLAGENRALRERLSRLSEASQRINESLDLDTVLQSVLDSACSLCGARFGIIACFAEQGRAPTVESGTVESVLISGFSKQGPRLLDPDERSELLDVLAKLPQKVRAPHLGRYLGKRGLAETLLLSELDPAAPCLGVSIVHRGQRVGGIFLVGQDRRPFAAEDEDTLRTFSAQAALVIAHARRQRIEQRMQADLETFVETSPVGVAVFNARSGAPILVNREALRMIRALNSADHPGEQLLSFTKLRRADGRELSLGRAALAQALGGGETVQAEEVVLSVEGGGSVTALLNATPIRRGDGAIESCITTLQDMTSMQEQVRLRAEFLAMVSHELRTPLSSVKGSIATLLDPASGLSAAEQYQFHRIIDAQAERMRILISDLLDVARIETGMLSTSPEPTDLSVLVGEAAEAFRSGGGRHAIEAQIADNLPWVMADRSRLLQVLSNLISNAARNSNESCPVRVGVAREGIDLVVSVSDDGRGIPSENLPLLFQKFSRLSGDESGGETGLGLAICKGIVEAHGGRIWAESDGPGLGARFAFTIPTVDDAVRARLETAAAEPGRRAEATQTRIVVVDDDPEALRLIRDTLLKSGYEPIVTGDPSEVMPLLKKQPQLVLLDLLLPGVDGIELMRKIHEVRDLPVLFISAYGLEEAIERAFDAGASDYIVKPFTPTELTARIRAALRKQAPPEPQGSYVSGDLRIDYAQRRVTVAGQPVRLAPIEYRTLAELSGNAGRIVTYGLLLQRVWGVEQDADLRPMRTVISTLRRRLADSATRPKYLFTEPRVGYRMALPDS